MSDALRPGMTVVMDGNDIDRSGSGRRAYGWASQLAVKSTLTGELSLTLNPWVP
jgi:hypothetical protein